MTPHCAALDQIFTEEAGRIGPEILRRTNTNNAWNALVEQDKFPEGMGSILSSLVYNRAVFNPATFTPLASSTTPTPADQYPDANTPFQPISVPKSKFQYQLERADFKSDDICLEDLRFAFEVKQQMTNQLEQLGGAMSDIMTERRRSEYTRLAQHKVIAAVGLPEDPTDFNNIDVLPTTRCTQKILDIFYTRLNRDGAQAASFAKDQGRPVYMVILSSEMENGILLDEPEIRKDFRFSKEVETLLAPMGIERTYNGFFHMNDDFSPRWDYVDGEWTRRWPWDSEGEVSALYEAAAFEDVIVFLMDVYTELVPTTYDGIGKASFNGKQVYRGEWEWMNIRDRHCNPWGNTGFFASRLVTASKPGLIKHGYVVRCKRCPLDIGAINCTYGS